MNKHSLKGKAAIVGGGAKNLGGLISRSFAAEGAKVCVHYNRVFIGCNGAESYYGGRGFRGALRV